MGNKTSNPQRRIVRESNSNRRSSADDVTASQLQQQTLPPLPPPQYPPLVTTALPDPDLPLSMLSSQSHTPNLSSNVLTTDEDTFTDSPNSIMASAIPEVYYASDMIHIDSPEPALSIDLSVPSFVAANGEISQAYPEPDPYINNYVELYGVPPAPPLDDPNGIRDPNFRDSFVTIGGIKLAQPRKKDWHIPTRDEYLYSFYRQTNNWF